MVSSRSKTRANICVKSFVPEESSLPPHPGETRLPQSSHTFQSTSLIEPYVGDIVITSRNVQNYPDRKSVV